MELKSVAATLKRWGMIVLGASVIFSFCAGIVTMLGAVNELRLMKAARSWEGRPGIIRVSYARELRGPAVKKPRWKVEAAGDYADGSGSFAVMRLAYGFGNGGGTRRRGAEAAAKRYPPGTELTVYPAPGRPKWVVLDNDPPARLTYAGLLAGFAGALLPFILFFLGTFRRRARSQG